MVCGPSLRRTTAMLVLVGACLSSPYRPLLCLRGSSTAFNALSRNRRHQIQEAAAKKGVRIVHTCGWDSVPTDLASLLVARQVQRVSGLPCARVEHVVLSIKGSSFSGGTIASMFEMLKATSSQEERGPYALSSPVRSDGARDYRPFSFVCSPLPCAIFPVHHV